MSTPSSSPRPLFGAYANAASEIESSRSLIRKASASNKGTTENRMVNTFDGAEFGTFNRKLSSHIIKTDISSPDDVEVDGSMVVLDARGTFDCFVFVALN